MDRCETGPAVGKGRRPGMWRELIGIAAAAVLLAGVGCGPREVSEEREAPVRQELLLEDEFTAFVRSTAGEVELVREEEVVRAAPGQRLETGDRVVTGSGAGVEFQIGTVVLARVGAESEVTLGGVRYPGESPRLLLDQQTGRLVVRSDLGEKAGLSVRTPEAVIDSVGTLFVVERDEEATSVGVGAGRARVHRSGVDLRELADAARVEELVDVIEGISAGATIVDADGAVTVRAQEVDEAASALREVKQELKTGEEIVPEMTETLAALLRYAQDQLERSVPEERELGDDERVEISRIEESTYLRPPAEHEAASRGLATVTIRTIPEDADVFLDGHTIGKEIYSGLFEPGQEVELTASHPDYETQAFRVSFEPDLDEEVVIELDRIRTVGPAEFLRAARQGNIEEVDAYVAAGGDPNVADEEGRNAIAYALGAAHLELEDLASFDPPVEVISILLDHGIDPDRAFAFQGQELTPLTLAVLGGMRGAGVQHRLVEMLLDAGADVTKEVEAPGLSVDAFGMAVIMAAEEGAADSELLRLLVESGADPNRKLTYEGREMNPLVAAVDIGGRGGELKASLVEELLRHGADPEREVAMYGRQANALDVAERHGLYQALAVLRGYQSE